MERSCVLSPLGCYAVSLSQTHILSRVLFNTILRKGFMYVYVKIIGWGGQSFPMKTLNL